MTNVTREDWLEINQKCLIAEVNVVKAKVMMYRDNLAGSNKSDKSAKLLEKAKKEVANIKSEDAPDTRLKTLVELFHLSPFEMNVLLLAIGIELDASLGILIVEIQGNDGHGLPTINVALSVFDEAHWSAFTPDAPLRYWQLISVNKNETFTNSSFSVDELILHFLTGINTMDGRISPLVTAITTFGDLVKSHQEVARNITQYLSRPTDNGITPIIHLEGKSIKDQKAIIASIFTDYNLMTYYLPVQLLPTNFNEVNNFAQLWNREAILNQYVLFLDAKEIRSADKSQINHVKYLLDKLKGIVVISTEHRFTSLNRLIQSIAVEKPSREEQQLLWKEQLGTVAETLDGDIGNLVTQFSLDSHTISHLAQIAVSNAGSNGSISPDKPTVGQKLWKSCCNHTRPSLASLAQRIPAIATWDDLVLPKAKKEILNDICIHVRQRQKVYYDWGFSSKSNRGLGISALFSGESGTGKTMASEVIANTLQLDLYRIDLSQVINKYIGETEKNLKKIFDAAEDSGAILLFDEADALFGKRSEVKDSHDRHSNIEVSYLLQKMEEYRGLAILTTNMKSALDNAFLRRIRFVIQFPFPDAQLRSEIWKRVFPIQTPVKELSLSKLANLSVAGGNIRNIALNASFAAANKNQPVTMLDIHNAARNEYIKLEKHMSPSESLI